MKDDRVALSQILERIERVDGSGIDRDRFLRDSMAQDAVIRNLEVIGETTKRLTPTTKALVPGTQWKRIAGFRDWAIHGYDTLDLGTIWGIVERDLPRLKAGARRALRQLGRAKGHRSPEIDRET